MELIDLHDKALECLSAGSSFQSCIRDFISERQETLTNKSIADELSIVVSNFKTEGEIRVKGGSSDRKVLNNIINDVSRICRDMLGYTIKCTKRKGGYTYEAFEIPPPKPKATLSPVEPTFDPFAPTPANDPAHLKRYVEDLVLTHGAEAVAKELLPYLK